MVVALAYVDNKGHIAQEKSMYESFTFGILCKPYNFLRKMRVIAQDIWL